MAGIIDTIKLAAVLVLAIPAALAGLEFMFVRDQPALGGALLGLAIGLLVLKRYLTLPTDIPAIVAKRVGRTIVSEPDADTEPVEED